MVVGASAPKFRFQMKWKRKFPENHFEIFGQPLEVILFSGNLDIPEISVLFDISNWYESAPVPLVVPGSYKMAAS